jgi:branched-chain amino acid transport system permease protein
VKLKLVTGIKFVLTPLIAVVIGVALIAGQEFFSSSHINAITNALLLVSIGVTWNLVAGIGGQFSLGHAIFVGVGAYGTAIFVKELGLPVPIAALIAAVVASLIGVVLAYPMLRLRGPYFAIGTLALSLAVLGWMVNWEFTNKSQAYSFPIAALPSLEQLMAYATILAVGSFVAVWAVAKSPFGLRLVALREDEAGAISLGVRRTANLVPVWALTTFLTGLVGAVFGLQRGSLDPGSAFGVQFTIDAIVVSVIGGLGTLTGPVIGAILIFILRQFADTFDVWALLIEGVVVIVFVRFIPGGLVGVVQNSIDWVSARALHHKRD